MLIEVTSWAKRFLIVIPLDCSSFVSGKRWRKSHKIAQSETAEQLWDWGGGGGWGGEANTDSMLGGTKHFFLLILYNFKNIGGGGGGGGGHVPTWPPYSAVPVNISPENVKSVAQTYSVPYNFYGILAHPCVCRQRVLKEVLKIGMDTSSFPQELTKNATWKWLFNNTTSARH